MQMQMPRVFNQLYESNFAEYYEIALNNPRKRIITDITTITIDGIELRKWHFDQTCCEGGDESYILSQTSFTERIGFDGFLFPILSIDFLEFNPLSDLFNFEDNDLSYTDSDNWCMTSSTEEEMVRSFITVNPNPTSGELSIELHEVIQGRLTVKSLTGQVLLSYDINYQDRLELDLSGQNPGIYAVEVISESGEQWVERVVLF